MNKNLLTAPVLFLSSFIMKHKNEYYKLLREITEKQNWHDWILYMLSAISETSALTIKKISDIQALKEEIALLAKSALKDSYSRDLLELIFSYPYVKIKALEKHKIAKRQTASVYLQKLAQAGILKPIKVGKEYYYINHRLMKIIAENDEFDGGYFTSTKIRRA